MIGSLKYRPYPPPRRLGRTSTLSSDSCRLSCAGFHVLLILHTSIYTCLKKRCRVKCVNYRQCDTMELWEDGRGEFVTGFCFMTFKIFSFHDNLKSKLRHNVHVTKNRGKYSRFPEHHWVASSTIYAFHPTTFFQLGVYEFSKRGVGMAQW